MSTNNNCHYFYRRSTEWNLDQQKQNKYPKNNTSCMVWWCISKYYDFNNGFCIDFLNLNFLWKKIEINNSKYYHFNNGFCIDFLNLNFLWKKLKSTTPSNFRDSESAGHKAQNVLYAFLCFSQLSTEQIDLTYIGWL